MLSGGDRARRVLVHLALNLQHYAAAVWGIGLRFDPAIVEPDFRGTWPAIQFWAALMVYAVVRPDVAMWAGLALFWISPLWAIAALGLMDPVFEYRGYGAHLGLALIVARLVPAPWIWILVSIWALESCWRSRFLETGIGFWQRVIVENHGYGMRAQQQYARLLIYREGLAAAERSPEDRC